MKIYTRTGDDGTTGLYGGERVAKNDPLVVAYGAVDEANAALGLARSLLAVPGDSAGTTESASVSSRAGRDAGTGADLITGRELDALLDRLQNTLFDVGADLATPLDAANRGKIVPISPDDAALLEAEIDRYQQELEPLTTFILPGGHPAAAALHLARTVVRRAEREVVGLGADEINRQVAVYLNRLSDLLFVLARAANSVHGRGDVGWRKRSPAVDAEA